MELSEKEIKTLVWCLKNSEDEIEDRLTDVDLLESEVKELKADLKKVKKLRFKLLAN